MKIPIWDEAKELCEQANPLITFIYDNEPAGPEAEKWRTQLQELVDYAHEQGYIAGQIEITKAKKDE